MYVKAFFNGGRKETKMLRIRIECDEERMGAFIQFIGFVETALIQYCVGHM